MKRIKEQSRVNQTLIPALTARIRQGEGVEGGGVGVGMELDVYVPQSVTIIL